MIPLNRKSIAILGMLIVLNWGNVSAQLDERFGAVGVEGTAHLGQCGLKWYKDWHDSYLIDNYPAPGKQKIWTVGKIDYRTDDLGMDYKWIILDLLEETNINFLQSFLNLSLAIVDKTIIPLVDDYWKKNAPAMEATFEEMLNNFVYTDMMYRIKYRAKTKKTHINLQEELPEFDLSVIGDTIKFNTSITVDWKTHIYIEAWIFNPNPFNWGYYWKDMGDANCDFKTIIKIPGEISILEQGRDRHLQIQAITPDSKTESDIDWSTLGIDFSWEGLSNSVEDVVDKQIEKTLSDELNKEPITRPYYLVDFFKSLFPGEIVPTQAEVLDRIFQGEKKYIEKVLAHKKFEEGFWSIGYEPNWFPIMEPEQYAEYYTNYYRLIKELDAEARILGPSINLTEVIENPGDIAFSFIPPIFLGMFSGIEDELKGFINSYFQAADSKVWFSKFIEYLPADVSIDVNDFHIFPMNAENQVVDWDSLKLLIENMANFMRNSSGVEDVWISEFGNIDGRRSEMEVAELCRNFSRYFKTNTAGITKWFWFLSRGHSPFYDMPISPQPPKTALLDKNFALTQIGLAYLLEADNTAPIMESAPTVGDLFTQPKKVVFHWKEAKEYDTGISNYQITVKYEPEQRIVFDKWIGNRLFIRLSGYAGKKLYARVRAKNGAGLIGNWSDWSNGISVTALGKKDSSDLIITDNSDTEITSNLPSTPTSHFQNNENLQDTESVSMNVPNSFGLSQNYPNPFNPSTHINYQLAEDGRVKIKIYNSLGQEIKTLVDENKAAAYYTVQWDGRDNYGTEVVSGIYLYRIMAGSFVSTKKMAVMR